MDPFKRLDKMIEDLKSLQESLRKLEQNKKECRDLERPIKKRRLLKQPPLPSGKNDPMEVESAFLDSCDIASKHISGDLLKAWSKIRGYKLEADILVKQVARSRRVLTEESRKKQGDAASSGRPGKRHLDLKEVTRVYQAKTVSAAGNSSVKVIPPKISGVQ